MQEQAVCQDKVDSPVGDIVFDENNVERRSWHFCNNIHLPRSEVVFFVQMIIVALIISVSCCKLFYNHVDCEERTIWVSLLSSTVGYILPNPRI